MILLRPVVRLFFSVLFLMALPGVANADPVRIAVYGDSLTSGYQISADAAFPNRLYRKLKEIGFDNFQVLNLSVSGETTAGGLERMNVLLSKRPNIVLLHLGGTDILRGIDTDMIAQNLRAIIARLKANNVYVILVGNRAPATMGYEYAKAVEAMYRQLADANQLAFYPYALEGVVENPEYNLADGYHPSAKGVDVMVEGMYRMVDAALRWHIEAVRYQEYQKQYMQQWQRENDPHATELPASPSGEPPPQAVP